MVGAHLTTALEHWVGVQADGKAIMDAAQTPAMRLFLATPLVSRKVTANLVLSVSNRLLDASPAESVAIVTRCRAIAARSLEYKGIDNPTAMIGGLCAAWTRQPSEADYIALGDREMAGRTSESRFEFWAGIAALMPSMHRWELLRLPVENVLQHAVLLIAAETAWAFSESLTFSIHSQLAWMRSRAGCFNVGMYGSNRLSFYGMAMEAAIEGHRYEDYTVGGFLAQLADLEDMTDGPRARRKDRFNKIPAAYSEAPLAHLRDAFGCLGDPWFSAKEVMG